MILRTSKFSYSLESKVIWLTGLSAPGKSTIANALHDSLKMQGLSSVVLDGDSMRAGIDSDLKFSRDDRAEASRRVSEVARLFADSGVIAIVAMISPFADDRLLARKIVEPYSFIEVWVNTDLKTCIERDPKNLYKKSMSGEVTLMTGVSEEYEAPVSPDLEVSGSSPIEVSVQSILSELLNTARFLNASDN